MAKVALINYYARLLQKGQLTISDIPEEYREMVLQKESELPPLEDLSYKTYQDQ